jgi:hypothetical protein
LKHLNQFASLLLLVGLLGCAEKPPPLKSGLPDPTVAPPSAGGMKPGGGPGVKPADEDKTNDASWSRDAKPSSSDDKKNNAARGGPPK